MKRVFTFMLLALSCYAFAINDGKTFLDANFNPIADLSGAKYYRTVSKADKNLYFAEVYYLTDLPQMRGHYMDSLLTTLHGPCTYFHRNGKVESQGKYDNGKRIGSWKRFTLFGEEKTERYYPTAGELENKYEKETSLAKFNGSSNDLSEYLKENLTFPSQAELLEIKHGNVSINLSISDSGEIISYEVLSFSSEAFRREAIRVISQMPAWEPAIYKGKKVASNYIIRIPFDSQTKRVQELLEK